MYTDRTDHAPAGGPPGPPAARPDALPPPLLLDPRAGLRLLETRDDWPAAFGLERELPSTAFAEAVWQALIHFGRELPQHLRPLPPRPWQGAAVALLLEHAYASLQGARQGAGKTFAAALVITCHLLLGASVTVALPTYRQGSSILKRRVLLFMGLLEGPLGLKRERDNAHETAWDNGAELRMLSTSAGARRGTQGWTSRVVVIDESHDVAYKDLAWFMPLVAMAMKQRRGRLLLLGVGAGPEAAPMQARGLPQYATLVLDDATIGELDRIRRAWLPACHAELDEESWAEFFAGERLLWDEEHYRQFYMCQSPASGQRKVFDRVPEVVTPDTFGAADCQSAYGTMLGNPADLATSGFRPPASGFLAGLDSDGRSISGLAVRYPQPISIPAHYFLGVDVGKQRDQTVVAVLEQRGSVYNLVDCVRLPLGMAYTEQARQLAALARAWGCPPGRFAVEVNGPGQALYDLLADPLDPAVWHATPVHMTVERKTAALRRLASDMRRGLMGVAEIPLAGSRVVESGLPVGTRVSASAVGPDVRTAHGAEVTTARVLTSARTADSLTAVPTGTLHSSSIRSHLASLNVYYSDDGIAHHDHSDVLSALIVARCAMDEAALI